MWTIHRVESTNGDLTVYARCPDGGEFPRWAVGEVLAKSAEILPCGTHRMRGTVRSLTTAETKRERREAAGCEATLDTVCVSADRRAIDALAAEIRQCNETVTYAAIDFPGGGWRGDSAAYVHIPVGG